LRAGTALLCSPFRFRSTLFTEFSMGEQKETLGFQAEVKQLLHLMIHSLYSNKEIFLRELISNASDAADKLRFEALNNAGAATPTMATSKIRVAFDKEARTLSITDNGIGLSREEAIEHLGTIARSGTARVLLGSSDRRPAQGRAADRSVRRGLLFAFIVADQGRGVLAPRRARGRRRRALGIGRRGRVHVETSSAPSAAPRWCCTCARARTSSSRAGSARDRRKYSDHITLPVLMKKERWDEEKKARTGGAGRMDETVNQATALWTRPKSESPRRSTTSSTSTSRTISRIRSPGATRVEGKQEYTRCCTSLARAVRPVEPRLRRAASSSMSGARSSWTTPSS
jgi:molecular chaperone HtpG